MTAPRPARRPGVYFLAIVTGFRDVDRAPPPSPFLPYAGGGGPERCGEWVAAPLGWERPMRCMQVAAAVMRVGAIGNSSS